MVNQIETLFNKNYSQYKKSLSEISCDTSKTNPKSNYLNGFTNLLCLSKDKFFSYDDIAKYENRRNTPDLITFRENKVIFIEFKAGKHKNINKDELKLKLLEGLNLLKLILDKYNLQLNHQDFCNLNKYFIVVYKLPQITNNNRTSRMLSYFNNTKIQFDLANYENWLFKKIYTPYCGNQFETIMKNIYQINFKLYSF